MPRFQRINYLLGETAREGGLLMLVLAPLESAVAERPLGAGLLIGVMAAGLAFIACGILLQASDS